MAAGATVLTFARCSGAKRPLGGGFYTFSDAACSSFIFDDAKVRVVMSYGKIGNNGWGVYLKNVTGATVYAKAMAVCATVN